MVRRPNIRLYDQTRPDNAAWGEEITASVEVASMLVGALAAEFLIRQTRPRLRSQRPLDPNPAAQAHHLPPIPILEPLRRGTVAQTPAAAREGVNSALVIIEVRRGSGQHWAGSVRVKIATAIGGRSVSVCGAQPLAMNFEVREGRYC
jgi:hypothetical protein